MSGEVILADTADGTIARLVTTAGALMTSTAPGSRALIGGLAVTARVAHVYRVTQDVDTVLDGEDQRDLMVLEQGGSGSSIVIDGVLVDLIATEPLPATLSDLPDDDGARLFLLSHRWALETASELAISVVAGSETVAKVKVPVATTPALVACKFAAFLGRPERRAPKRQSDALDIYRLSRILISDVALFANFADAPHDLVALLARITRRQLSDRASSFAGLMHAAASLTDERVDALDVEALGLTLSDLLGSM